LVIVVSTRIKAPAALQWYRNSAPAHCVPISPEGVFAGLWEMLRVDLFHREPQREFVGTQYSESLSESDDDLWEIRLKAYPKTVGDWLILRSLRSKMCLSPSPQTVFG
jgi:hypothetical protein